MSYYESKSSILSFTLKLVLYYCGSDANIKKIILCRKSFQPELIYVLTVNTE